MVMWNIVWWDTEEGRQGEGRRWKGIRRKGRRWKEEGRRESRKWAGGKGGQIGTRVSAKTIILINIFLRRNVWIVKQSKEGWDEMCFLLI